MEPAAGTASHEKAVRTAEKSNGPGLGRRVERLDGPAALVRRRTGTPTQPARSKASGGPARVLRHLGA